MKIALYAHNLHQAGGLSVGRSITSVLPKLSPQNQFFITVPSNRGYDSLKNYPNVTLFECPVGSYFTRIQFELRMARFLAKNGCDWSWVLGNNLMVLPHTPISTLLHSPYHLDYPYDQLGLGQMIQNRKFKLTKFFVRRTLLRSRKIYGQTQTVCKRISETFNIPSEKIFQCSMGNPLKQIVQNDTDIPEMAKKILSVQGKFKLIYVSAYYLHKNHARIIDLFTRYHNDLKNVACFLTIDPDFSPTTQQLYEKVKACGLQDSIYFIGSVPHQQISHCYRAADACFYPTLLETVGFGHLEAMYYHLPVIASDLDFAHEVCGDAAIFIDPFSLESMRDGILQLTNDSQLRQDLIQKGEENIKKQLHSWEENLIKVLDFEGIEHI